MPKKGFIDCKSAKHYHVVHCSQRDPLINDAEASSRVLQEVVPGNLVKHKTAEELERIRAKPKKLTQDEIDQRVGQAALHGIYFDDGEYDYMQHLKPIGAPDAIFLEAPTARKEKNKQPIGGLQLRDEIEEKNTSTSGGKGLFDDVDTKKNPNLFELPTDVLPSNIEVDTRLMNQTGLEGGLQPDMDPRLREILEALEDDAYVENDLDESFFDDLNDESAEVYDPDEDEYYDDVYNEEYGDDEEVEYEDIEEDGPIDPENYDWQAAFNKFKRDQKRSGGSDDEFDDDDDFDIRSKGTGFSVSSSAMHRNAQLRTLDDRFDRIEEEYMNDDDEEEEREFDGDISKERADFEAILDDFLDNYEVVGNKIAPKLEGENSVQKLDTIRKTLDRIHIKEEVEDEDEEKAKKQRSKSNLDDPWARPEQRKKATWDCQSVLSTYSNLENHPTLISDRGPKKKISIDPKTGMPILVEDDRTKNRKKNSKYNKSVNEENNNEDDNEEDDDEDEDEEDRPNLGVRRSKAESKEDKKLRKQAIKDAKKNRREEKKSTKAAFKNEENRQRQTLDQQRKAKGVTHIY
ncbi:unnamed protein product [Cunninghamella blakesleeana]